MRIEEKLKRYSDGKAVLPTEEKLQETIRRSQTVWYQAEAVRPLSGFHFLMQQLGYIRKCWWLLQALVLAVLWLLLQCNGATLYTRRCMGVFAPLFVILWIPELWKSQNCGCMEIETASFFSIRKIYAARVLWFLMADLLLLSIFGGISVVTLWLSIRDIVVQFLLPMNVTGSICFLGLCSHRAGSDAAAFGASILWVGVWTLVVQQEKIYRAITAPMWTAAAVLSLLLCVCSIYRAWKKCGQYLEVNLLWN